MKKLTNHIIVAMMFLPVMAVGQIRINQVGMYPAQEKVAVIEGTTIDRQFDPDVSTGDYSKPVVKSTKEGLTASITVTNSGKRAGKEVVQLYVSPPAGGIDKPARELKAFAKTRELHPGQSETLTMSLSFYDLASYNEATQSWETASGKYTVSFGANVDDIRATAPYNLSEQHDVKCHDVMKPSMPL